MQATRHHTNFIKEFGDFLDHKFGELLLAADKVLIVGDFNIHVDNEIDALGSAFIDILNSIGVRQHVSGPTHCQNHTVDLILSHRIYVFFFFKQLTYNVTKIEYIKENKTSNTFSCNTVHEQEH